MKSSGPFQLFSFLFFFLFVLCFLVFQNLNMIIYQFNVIINLPIYILFMGFVELEAFYFVLQTFYLVFHIDMNILHPFNIARCCNIYLIVCFVILLNVLNISSPNFVTSKTFAKDDLQATSFVSNHSYIFYSN